MPQPPPHPRTPPPAPPKPLTSPGPWTPRPPPPPERQAGKIVGEGAAAVGELVRLLREEAKVL